MTTAFELGAQTAKAAANDGRLFFNDASRYEDKKGKPHWVKYFPNVQTEGERAEYKGTVVPTMKAEGREGLSRYVGEMPPARGTVANLATTLGPGLIGGVGGAVAGGLKNQGEGALAGGLGGATVGTVLGVVLNNALNRRRENQQDAWVRRGDMADLALMGVQPGRHLGGGIMMSGSMNKSPYDPPLGHVPSFMWKAWQ